MRPESRIVPATATLEPPNRLVGYAAKFHEPSSPLWDEDVCDGPFVEVIEPGAFTASLRDHPDVRALFNHASGAILGRTKSGTLKLTEDDIGLAFDLTLPNTSAARDLQSLIARGDIDGCSFGFYSIDEWLEDLGPSRPAIRHLVEVHVYEITPATTFPAYEATSVELRSLRSRSSAPGKVAPAPAGSPAPTPRLNVARDRLRLAGF